MCPLPLTGERTVPGISHENYWFRRHEAAYEHVRGLVTGTALEVGCGEGYGTALLAETGHPVLGLDYDRVTVAHAAQRYAAPSFVRGNLAAVPVRTASVEWVITLQVIEHVWDHGEFLGECHRVLSPGGSLIVSTPNRLTFSPGLDTPVNPFHTKEFTAAELVDLLIRCGFAVDRTLGLHHSSRLRALDERYGGFVSAQLATAPEQWTSALAAEVAAVTTADFVLTDEDVDASLDLLVLARRDDTDATA